MPNCKQCNTGFEISDEEHQLYEKFGHEPTGFCFECDQKQRLCYRNERFLYNRKCDATGANIVTIYSPDKPYKVYKNDAWFSDTWDAQEFGQKFDFSRPFFEQLKELQLKVPRLALLNLKGENSEYCNMCVGNKNCYLVFGGDFNEDMLYGTLCMHNRNSVDLDFSNHNELCYFLGDTIGSYGCQFAFDSKNCKNCYFVSDCSNCTECILCTNLSNKSYCIENQQLSKEEYLKKKEELITGSYQKQQELWKQFLGLRDQRIVKFSHMISCQNCSGDYLKNSKNCHNCYDVSDGEDLRNVIFASKAKDLFNCSLSGDGTENCYNQMATVGAVNCRFSYFVFDSSDIEYSDQIQNSHNCFGCVGLNHKQFCILNKQYKKEEYEALRQKIIEHMKKTGEWGQFLPKTLSCFSYQETTAHDYYPLTREQALEGGFKWSDLEERKPEAEKVIHAKQLPDDIKDVPDDILNCAIEPCLPAGRCEATGKLFKIVPQELKFYRNQNLPVPHFHPDERHHKRMELRNLRKLWKRQCQKCNKEIQTTYSPDRPEKVYCEECYLKTVY